MNKHKKTAVIMGIFIFFGMHFLLTFNYISEGRYSNKILNKITSTYMLPLFHQNWKLFAPNPPLCQPKLLIRYSTDGHIFSSWQLVAQNLSKTSSIIHISPSQKLYRLNEGMARHILFEYSQLNNPQEINTIKRKKVYESALQLGLQEIIQDSISPTQVQLAVCCNPIKQHINTVQDTLFLFKEDVNQFH